VAAPAAPHGRGRPLLLGHRGARQAAPENTFAAFDLCLEHGCDGFELDVRCTSDRRTVICHDPRLARREVAGSTYDALQGSVNRRRRTPGFGSRRRQVAGVNLRCLEDVLAHYGSRAFLDIEIKVAGIEDLVLAALAQHPPREFVVSSFLPEVLLELRRRAGAVPLGLICDRADQLAHWPEPPVELVVAQYRLVTAELIERLHAAGKRVLVWTVNDSQQMLRFAGWGADGLISDDTELLARTFASEVRDRFS
jgi:glycerophosphoryl diester phosphodiesterase